MAAQRWWRTLPDDVTAAGAQVQLDAWCREHGDVRVRVVDILGTRCTVPDLAAAESLRPPPAGPLRWRAP